APLSLCNHTLLDALPIFTRRGAALTAAAVAALSYPLALSAKPAGADAVSDDPGAHQTGPKTPLEALAGQYAADSARADAIGLQRSEEHTSELQSLAYLVC